MFCAITGGTKIFQDEERLLELEERNSGDQPPVEEGELDETEG